MPTPRPISAELSGPSPYEDRLWERSRKELAALERAGTYIVTSAQNNTAPDAGFLAALKQFCNHRDARLIVIPTRYKNPTRRSDPQEEEAAERASGEYWWHPDLRPYLIEQEIQVHPKLSIMGHVRIQATSPWPMRAAIWARSQDRSAIYGHPQLSMISAPGRSPKLLYTTGAVTKENYSFTLAGDLAKFHHTLGAIIVEVRGKRFHLREVTWDGGCFVDLNTAYSALGASESGRILALVTGDTHARFVDPEVVQATYRAKDSICAVLEPEVLVWHDVFDGFSVSPFMDRLTEAVSAKMGYSSVEAELRHLCGFIDENTPESATSVIVRSNHHTWLDRWVKGRVASPENLELWHELSLDMLRHAKNGLAGPELPDPLAFYCKKLGIQARFLEANDGLEIGGVELGMHGHLGPNGRRGTAGALSTLGYRSVVGHHHQPRIEKGVYQVGTSSRLRLGYNEGPSSWAHTHCAILPNGKRQLLHIIGGRWRG